jgi:hypothetical protein
MDPRGNFSLEVPDAASRQAQCVEMFLQLAHAILKECGDPEFVINALFGATITLGHDVGADPHRLQAAFRKMSELVFAAYAQRDAVKRKSEPKIVGLN